MIYLLIGFFIVLQLADIFLTKKILESGGYEKMKIARMMIEKFGIMPGLIFMKVLAIIPIIFVTSIYQGIWFQAALITFCAIYVKVVIHNYKEFSKIK